MLPLGFFFLSVKFKLLYCNCNHLLMEMLVKKKIKMPVQGVGEAAMDLCAGSRYTGCKNISYLKISLNDLVFSQYLMSTE